MPPVIPVTVPDVLTDAILEVALTQVPPVTDEDSANVAATQRDDPPLIVPAAGSGLTVMVCVAAAEPQVPVTVYEIVAEPAVRP